MVKPDHNIKIGMMGIYKLKSSQSDHERQADSQICTPQIVLHSKPLTRYSMMTYALLKNILITSVLSFLL